MLAPVYARCFGGGPLLGGKLVRIAYLDEAGISNPAHEPYLVVAGIILHADEHWRPIEEHMRAIGQRYLPDQPKPLFHAKDIFHGIGAFDRQKWPRERRWELLLELCEIPKKFEIPVVFSWHHRERHRQEILKTTPNATVEHTHLVTHADVFVKAAMAIEGWMRLGPNRSESVMIIAEDTPKVKQGIKAIHAGYTDRFKTVGLENMKLFHSNHIVDTVHFAGKRDSMPLQIADACAFMIKRHLMEKEDSVNFFAAMRPQIVYQDSADVLWMAQAY